MGDARAPDTWQCPHCRAVSDLPEDAYRFPVPGRKETGCAWCARFDGGVQRETASRFMACIWLVASLLHFATLGMGRLHDGTASVVFGAFWWTGALVIVHELTHAAAGVAVGGRLRCLRLGWGRTWRSRRFAGVDLELGRQLWSSGWCRVSFAEDDRPLLRARLLVFYLAPHALHASLLWWVLTLPGDFGTERTSFAIANGLLVLGSLRDGSRKEGLRGDFLLARDLLVAWDAEATARGQVAYEALCLAQRGRDDDARAMIDRALEHHGDDAVVLAGAVGVFAHIAAYSRLPEIIERLARQLGTAEGAGEGDAVAAARAARMNSALDHLEWAEYAELFRCLSPDDEDAVRAALEERLAVVDDPAVRALYARCLANLDLWALRDAPRTEGACERADDALRAQPWSPYTQHTVALASVRRGDAGAARAAVREARRRAADADTATHLLVESVVLAAEGRLDRARAVCRRAVRHGARPELLQCVEAELERRAASATRGPESVPAATTSG